jgi:hypothetical protein
VLRQNCSRRSQCIDVWRQERSVAEAPEVAVAKVLCRANVLAMSENKHEGSAYINPQNQKVGALACFFAMRPQQEQAEEQHRKSKQRCRKSKQMP